MFGVWNFNIDESIVLLKVPGTVAHQTSCVFTFHVMNARFKIICILYLYHTSSAVISRFIKVKVKVKQSHYRPGQALRVPGG